MEKIFISYNHKDISFVNKLAESLRQNFNIWLDKVNIRTGVHLIEQITANIETSNYMLAIISSNSVTSRWVKKELSIANVLPISLIPIVIDNCPIPTYLKAIPYIDFSEKHIQYEEALQSLVNMVKNDVIIHPHLVLTKLEIWGEIIVEYLADYGCRINSKGTTKGASGLRYTEPIFISDYVELMIEISGSSACDFSGWVKDFPRMAKVELNGQPVLARKIAQRSTDDKTYVTPADTIFRYKIPQSICQEGYIKRLEITLGKGKIKNLALKVSFA